MENGPPTEIYLRDIREDKRHFYSGVQAEEPTFGEWKGANEDGPTGGAGSGGGGATTAGDN